MKRGVSSAHVLALGAIALWVSLAALGVALQHVPPFLLTGIALLVGSLVALPLSGWNWRVKTSDDLAFARGVYDALHSADPDFCMNDVLDLLDSRHDLAKFAA